jgi:leader peptidase (prepilin peptidase) / N-methyltransferase
MSTPSIAIPAPRASSRRLSPRGRTTVAAGGTIVVALCLTRFGLSGRALVDSIFAATLVYLAAFDIEHRLIPNRVVLPATAVVLGLQILLFPSESVEWIAAAAGAGAFFLVTLLIYPPGLGMGDVKLALLLGAALGTNVVGAVLLGTVAAAIFGLVRILRDGSEARKRAIAFGPFLALGGLLVLLLA